MSTPAPRPLLDRLDAAVSSAALSVDTASTTRSVGPDGMVVHRRADGLVGRHGDGLRAARYQQARAAVELPDDVLVYVEGGELRDGPSPPLEAFLPTHHSTPAAQLAANEHFVGIETPDAEFIFNRSSGLLNRVALRDMDAVILASAEGELLQLASTIEAPSREAEAVVFNELLPRAAHDLQRVRDALTELGVTPPRLSPIAPPAPDNLAALNPTRQMDRPVLTEVGDLALPAIAGSPSLTDAYERRAA